MDPLAPKRNVRSVGFLKLYSNDDDDDGEPNGNNGVNEKKELGSYHEEKLDGNNQAIDPYLNSSRNQSTLSMLASNLAPNLASPEAEGQDLTEYAELAVARIVADDKTIETQTEQSKVKVSTQISPDDEYPMDEPPRISPVPVVDDTKLGISTKPKTYQNVYYKSDPPATLIIQSFRARSTPFSPREELSDTSPILHSLDVMTSDGQEVVNAGPASDTGQASDCALIQAQEKADDPEVGCKQITPPPSKPDSKASKSTHQVFALLLYLSVCFSTAYLVVFIKNFIQSREEAEGNTFVGNKPTTTMDPFEPGCSFANYTQPHVIGQCICNGEISIMTDDVREKYYSLNTLFASMRISNVWELPEESCDPRNQALVWLATFYATDQDDLVQKYLLASFFIQMAGEQWEIQEGWLTDTDKCRWSGVACDESGHFVKSIFLDGNGVKGSIPVELYRLTTLKELSLAQNQLSGTIPVELFSLPEIKRLSLSKNKLSGTIPQQVAQASKLEVFQLEMNAFDGAINSAIGQLTLLKELIIGYNHFVGTLPMELFQLTDLQKLTLDSNTRITGRLPPEISNFRNMEVLSLSKTSILSRIPTQVGRLTNLRVLNVANSQMSGILPTEIAGLPLNHLDLSNGKFRRGIPSLFGQLTSLTYLSLHDNQLTGRIPTELGNLRNLMHLSLENNFLFGEIPTHLGYLTLLDTLTLQSNFLTGRAPNEVCNLRAEELIVLSTDCSGSSKGVLCPVPSCCTSCVG